MIDSRDLEITSLGQCHFDSPVVKFWEATECRVPFITDNDRVVFNRTLDSLKAWSGEPEKSPSLEIAGPREKIFFDPQKTKAAIVTCGGLCPGINDVIRGLVMLLFYRYGVKEILGIPYGYQGFIPEFGHEPRHLRPEDVLHIHREGGTILASSRGQQDVGRCVDFLEEQRIQLLFVIGGDGTLRGALEIADEVERRGLKISVTGIPKTIDNDIMHIDQSFGFETAFSEAVRAISSADVEANGAPNGIGLVKLMGRQSGFIACYAALAMNDVNYVLIPEVPFHLEGEGGLLETLQRRLERKSHAVIVVSEGAGQGLIDGSGQGYDASGNIRFKDIGSFLKQRIESYFRHISREVNVKYIDPSYQIRSVPATPQDSVYCMRLAHFAVHAAMAGKTRVVVGRRGGVYVHIPMKLIAGGRKQVNPRGELWASVMESTGQPAGMFHAGADFCPEPATYLDF